jgi:hypothetical protein
VVSAILNQNGIGLIKLGVAYAWTKPRRMNSLLSGVQFVKSSLWYVTVPVLVKYPLKLFYGDTTSPVAIAMINQKSSG